MEVTLTPQQKRNAKKRAIRQRAKEGDPEAIAWVAKQKAVEDNWKRRKKEEGYNANSVYKKQARQVHAENKAKAALGDEQAALAVEAYRATRRERARRQRRRTGSLPMDTYRLYLSNAKEADHIKQEKARTYAREYKRRLYAAAKAGDPAAIKKVAEITEKCRLAQQRGREKKKAERQRFAQAASGAGALGR